MDTRMYIVLAMPGCGEHGHCIQGHATNMDRVFPIVVIGGQALL